MGMYKEIFEKLNIGEKILIVTTLDADQNKPCQTEKVWYTENDLKKLDFVDSINPEIMQAIQKASDVEEIQVFTTPEQQTIVLEQYFPKPRMVIFGGGHIAKSLCEFGAQLGFSITVIDDRSAFANKDRFPDADHVICESFEKCFDHLQFDPYTYVIIVTRGHRNDLVCLREIAKKTWAYAGMIGSRRRVYAAKEQLIDEGISREVLDKVNTPIGLEIGAVTPEEIAISILGQVISYRRLKKPQLGRESAKISRAEFDCDVIEELSFERNDEKAIATIISAKGSVPRKPGAKMIVWPWDGRILGSIGGGCGEGEVIQTARDVIQNGGCRIQTVDMTGLVAEDEGMVCGGIMKVLIESLTN